VPGVVRVLFGAGALGFSVIDHCGRLVISRVDRGGAGEASGIEVRWQRDKDEGMWWVMTKIR